MKRILVVAICMLTLTACLSNAVAAPFFSDTPKRAVFLSPVEKWMPTWNLDGYISPLQQAGYQVDTLFNERVSISFLMNGLSDYDIIILRTDSFLLEGNLYYCSGEPVTYDTSGTFADMISSGQLAVGACLGFSLVFVQSNYAPGSLRPGLVHVLGSLGGPLASVFIEAGASAFLCYDNPMGLYWGRSDGYSQALFGYLAQGYNMRDSVARFYIYLSRGHGSTANWPSVYQVGDGYFKI